MRPRQRDQRLAKAELIVAAWADVGLDGMALGEEDWALGLDALRSLRDRYELPILAANLRCGDERPFPASRVVSRGDLRIGLVGLTAGEVEGCEVGDPVAATREALAELGTVDITVALVPLAGDALARWAADAPGIDLAVDSGAGRYTRTPELMGQVWTVNAGSRGKTLGVTTLERVAGASGWAPEGWEDELAERAKRAQRRVEALDKRIASEKREDIARRIERQRGDAVRQAEEAQAAVTAWKEGTEARNRVATRIVSLDDTVADHAATRARVDAFLASIATEIEVPEVRPGQWTVVDGRYAGANACADCHPTEHTQWLTTPHARAWAALVEDDHAADQACFSCHVTGHGQGGPESPADVRGWQDVQCEACHGPSRAHAQDPMKAKPVRDPDVEVCTGCHDGERDEGRFEPDAYRARIVHHER